MASNPEDDFLQYEPAPEGAYRELGIGALQGATTDLGGSFADIGALTTGLASKIDPRLLAMSPTASALAAADPAMQDVAAEYGSEALGSRFFPAVPEGLEGYRDLGRLAGGVPGAGEAITARGSRALLGGIQDFMQYLPNVRPQAVTPDGQIIPLPDTSVTEMLASADTPGINPKYAKDIKKAESLAAKRLEDGEDPRKVFEETGFMRINVDARPGREAGDASLETKMVFDIPDNLTQINLGGLLPESVASKVSAGKSGEEVMDAFEKLKDPKNYFVEEFHRGGKYGRSVKFKLNQVLSKDHPLFDVFPELGEEIDVRIIEKPKKGSGGHWDNTTNTIAIGAKYLGNDRYTSTLFVHELAHVLQTRGDLPGGSSPFLVKESVPNKILDNFMLFQSTEALAEPRKSFNPFEFFHELRPKGDAKLLENIVEQARFNVKNADPSAPDNLARMFPGNLNSTARIDLDEMPYRDEVLAEMRRLIGKREEKAFKEAEAYDALGINVFRDKDYETGSLRLGSAAQGNYMKTRGEFMARLQEAYALATEGMPVGERRKLFPVDVATQSVRATDAAPGGAEGIAGVPLAEEKKIRPVTRGNVMAGTQLKSYDTEGAERGLVNVEGLINVDKIPEDLKKKIEYPSKAEGGVITMADVARSTGRGPKGVASLAPRARNMFRPMVS